MLMFEAVEKRLGPTPARAMPPRLTSGPVFLPLLKSRSASNRTPLRNPFRGGRVLASRPGSERDLMQTIEVIEGEDGWTVRQGTRILFTDTVEERSFRAALAISDALFDEGVPAQVVLVRLDG
jgi:hypothetical protein